MAHLPAQQSQSYLHVEALGVFGAFLSLSGKGLISQNDLVQNLAHAQLKGKQKSTAQDPETLFQQRRLLTRILPKTGLKQSISAS